MGVRAATGILSAGLIGGITLGAWRAREAVAGHGLREAGLGRLWRELVSAELLAGAGLGLAVALVALLLLGLLALLGMSAAARASALTCAGLVVGVGASSAWLMRGRLAVYVMEAPDWFPLVLRSAVAVAMLSLVVWAARWLYPRLRVRFERSASRGPRAGRVGLRALAAVAALALGGFALRTHLGRAAVAPDAPNLLLITIDTLRADHLGSHGYPRDTSPSLDALAEEGVRFERAMSQAPWTLPSMATLHTALYPSEHGADRSNRRLAPGHTTLAEVLRDGGYHTLGVISHLFVSDRFGFGQGFERFDQGSIAGHEGLTSRRLTRTALELVGERPAEPFFLWVHYFDPHYTYVDHPAHAFADPASVGLADRVSFEFLEERTASLSAEEVDQVIALYDEEIAHTDAAIGALHAGLEALALQRGLVTAVTADHGELFRERGRFGHGREVWAELVHVPLILHGPERLLGPPRVEPRPAEVRSLARSLLGLAGIESPHFAGADLLAPARGDELAFFEGGYASGDDSRKLGVLDGAGWKRVHDLDADTRELYQLVLDPGERSDRSGDPEAAAARAALDAALADWSRRYGPANGQRGGGAASDRAGARGSELDLAEGELEHLRDLGYVE